MGEVKRTGESKVVEPATENLACAERDHRFLRSVQASAAGPPDKRGMKLKEL